MSHPAVDAVPHSSAPRGTRPREGEVQKRGVEDTDVRESVETMKGELLSNTFRCQHRSFALAQRVRVRRTSGYS